MPFAKLTNKPSSRAEVIDRRLRTHGCAGDRARVPERRRTFGSERYLLFVALPQGRGHGEGAHGPTRRQHRSVSPSAEEYVWGTLQTDVRLPR